MIDRREIMIGNQLQRKDTGEVVVVDMIGKSTLMDTEGRIHDYESLGPLEITGLTAARIGMKFKGPGNPGLWERPQTGKHTSVIWESATGFIYINLYRLPYTFRHVHEVQNLITALNGAPKEK